MRGAEPACMRHVVVKGTVCAHPINGGRRGGVVHLLDGADARFSRRPLPTITGWGRGRLTRRLGSARLPRGSHVLGVANGGGRKPGVAGRGSRPVLVPCSSCVLIG